MSTDNLGAKVAQWWKYNLADRNQASCRALAARLRRANAVSALCEPQVIALARSLDIGPDNAQRLAGLVCLLAEVREESSQSLAKILADPQHGLSPLRFERLMRSHGEERIALMRRAIQMADRRLNVAKFASDVIYWNERTRIRWCFDYFGAEAPQDNQAEVSA